MTCITKTRKVTRVCAGALDKLAEVNVRAITAPNGDTVDYSMSFSVVKQVWGMMETLPNVAMFDSTNIERTVSHKWTMRYIPDVTVDSWIKYNGRYYDVVKTENYEERDEYYVLYLNMRGDATKPANFG